MLDWMWPPYTWLVLKFSWMAAFLRAIILKALASVGFVDVWRVKLKAKGREKSHRFNQFFLVEGWLLLYVSFVQEQLFCEGKRNWLLYLNVSYKVWFPHRPFRRDKSSEVSRLLGKFITEVGIALAKVTLELQGSFTLEMHCIPLYTCQLSRVTR